jgi:protein-S-isoprenylcysteine O-methyltransferase Ste14
MMNGTKPELPLSRIVAYVVIFPLVFAILLFLPAGTFDWFLGWLFFVVFLVLVLVSSLALWRLNPEIFGARQRIQPGTKGWDRILASVVIVLFAVVPIVAAFETARFGRAALPGWAIVLGYLLLVAGFAGTAWAQAVNRFFEPGVRIQTERGHHVIDTGPYALVRHPGYVAAFAMLAGMALALGSAWALVPAAVAAALLVLRTAWEDSTLRAELPGYADYARRVRYRLLPGVW